MTPGSMSTKSTEIMQEGLRLPAVRLAEGGRMSESLIDIICANSRLPDFTKGDLWAQIAACRRASGKISRLAETHGVKTFRRALADLFAEGEARARKGLESLPRGTWEIETEHDSGEIWRASIKVARDLFTVDLRDSPAQKNSPYNTSRDGAVISAQMIFKALTDPERFANAGSFRPLRVLTRPGTIFHAQGHAPHGYYFETRIRLYDMLWRCMAQAVPERLPAGHFGSICGTVIAGRHPGHRPPLHNGRAADGRLGRRRPAGPDLTPCTLRAHGETFNCPAEICEARYWNRCRL